MTAPDSDGTFKVTDRRRRPEETESVAASAPKSEPRPRVATPEAPKADAPRAAAPEAGQPEPASDRTLSGLFIMLASSAVMALGDAPDPMTGQVHRDLGQAAEIIDLVLLLREKTEGRRSAEETQILDEIIYDLQLRYVAATKRS